MEGTMVHGMGCSKEPHSLGKSSFPCGQWDSGIHPLRPLFAVRTGTDSRAGRAECALVSLAASTCDHTVCDHTLWDHTLQDEQYFSDFTSGPGSRLSYRSLLPILHSSLVQDTRWRRAVRKSITLLLRQCGPSGDTLKWRLREAVVSHANNTFLQPQEQQAQCGVPICVPSASSSSVPAKTVVC